MNRKIVAGACLGAAGALAFTLTTPALAGSASSTDLGVQVSASTLASGQITRGGVPLSGVRVELIAWPNEKTLAALPLGASVPIRRVGVATTNSHGAWSFNGVSLDQRYFDTSDSVDLTIRASAANTSATYDFTALRPSGPAKMTPNGAFSRPQVSLDLATRIAKDTYSGNETRQLPLAPNPSVATSLAGPLAPCGLPRAGAWHYGQPEKFLTVYSWFGNPAEITQSSGSKHELGIGYKDGTKNWTQSGSASMTKTAEVTDVMKKVYDMEVWNRVNYRDFTYCARVTYRKPINFHTLNAYTKPAGDTNFTLGCKRYAKGGGSFTKSSGKNVTYKGGVDIGPVNVSAQAGYDTKTSFRFDFEQFGGTICGNSAQGIVQASEISVKP